MPNLEFLNDTEVEREDMSESEEGEQLLDEDDV